MVLRFSLILFASITLIDSSTILAGQIAFSFDDAPTSKPGLYSGVQRTKRLIRALRKASIQEAVFFCNTKEIGDEGIGRLKAYASAGHLIANHTASHSDLHQVDSPAFITDIELAHKILSPLPNFVHWFRFPFLHNGLNNEQRFAVAQALERLGYKHGYVTVDDYDFYMNEVFRKAYLAKKHIDYKKLAELYVQILWDAIQFYDGLAIKTIGRSPKHVLLLHENDLAALFVPQLARRIRHEGWEIISPKIAYEDEISSMDPDINYGQGLIARIGKSKGLPPAQLANETEDEIVLDKIFADAEVFH